MAGIENEMAADSGRGRLRASHADREHVVGTLKAAYVHGLVTKDEFDERVSQTFASRTYAELARITADLPAGLTAGCRGPVSAQARTGHGQASGPREPDAGRTRDHGHGPVCGTGPRRGPLDRGCGGGLLALGGLGSAFVSAFLIGAQVRSSRRNTQSGGHRPPPRAAHGVRSRPPGGVCSLAAAAPNPGQPRRRGHADAALLA